ncbi:MAG: class I SAM-dependent methyltransferase [Parvularculaceae bacterium]
MDNARTFGANASAYAAGRPAYPPALFDWIAAEAPARGRALDVGAGSGQAALALAERFERVDATDVSAEQIAAAPVRDNIFYKTAPAERTGLPDAAVDVVTVATALHWFEFDAFWREVKRVSRPGALFAAWTYHRLEVDPQTETTLLAPIAAVIDPYWSDGNRLSWRGYPPAEVGFPFPEVAAPDFACELSWTAGDLVKFVRTWSAYARAASDGLGPDLDAIEAAAIEGLGDDRRAARLPLAVLAGRVNA